MTEPKPNMRAQAATRVSATTSVAWTCDVCKQPIRDQAGYLTVGYRDLAEHERARRQWETKHPVDEHGWRIVTGTELLEHPSPARWLAFHRVCDPNPDSCDYWIAVERIRTPAQVISWASHLLEKGWVQHTDWSGVLRGIATQLDGDEA